MGVNKNLIYLVLVDATAVLLAALGYLAVLTGYCLSKPQASILPYGLCAKLHLDLIPLAAITVGFIHGAAGFSLWIARIRKGLDLYIWIIGFIAMIYLIYLSII